MVHGSLTHRAGFHGHQQRHRASHPARTKALRAQGWLSNTMASGRSTAGVFNQWQQRSTAIASLHQASRGLIEQRSRAAIPAYKRALCARGRAGDTTASRCAQSGVFSQQARRGTAMPGSLTSARWRIVAGVATASSVTM